MTISGSTRACAAALLCALLLPAAAQARQGTLARAKDYYASASYDEALQVLDELRGKSPATAMTEVAAYQMFCLVALGRNQEATDAIQAIVRLDPLYRPSDVDASPRVRSFFENVRKPLLPTVVKNIYTKAKESLDKKEYSNATSEFDRVITLLDELGTASDQGIANLRTLASGFRDLSKAATPAPVAALPPAPVYADEDLVALARPVAASAASTAGSATVYGTSNPGIVAPVAIRRTMPVWHPINPIDKLRNFRGSVELVVDERGKVQSVTIAQPVHPDYDAALARAANEWAFQPATKNGEAVKYRLAMDILLTPTNK